MSLNVAFPLKGSTFTCVASAGDSNVSPNISPANPSAHFAKRRL